MHYNTDDENSPHLTNVNIIIKALTQITNIFNSVSRRCKGLDGLKFVFLKAGENEVPRTDVILHQNGYYIFPAGKK